MDEQVIINLLKRDPKKFDTIDLFSKFSKEQNLEFNNENDYKKFTEELANILKSEVSPTLLYGKWTEKLFSYLALYLGKCSLIKSEDSGDIFSKENIIIPDYRIILNDEKQIFVEVKNFSPKNNVFDYSISLKIFNQYVKYSEVMKIPLYFAIYWRKWGLWTLVDNKSFIKGKNKMSISLKKAMENNYMGMLGDFLIATLPPLRIRLYADKSKERKVIENNAEFVINRIDFYCSGEQIINKKEISIFLNLVIFGRWKENIQVIFEKEAKEKIDYLEFIYLPEETNPTQPFASIAYESEIISKQFQFCTFSVDGKVKKIIPNRHFNFGSGIPQKYSKTNLPLWLFHFVAPEK